MINTNKYISREWNIPKKKWYMSEEMREKHMRNNNNNSAICKLYRKFLLLWLLFSFGLCVCVCVFVELRSVRKRVQSQIIITFIQQLSFEMGSTVWSHHLMLFMDIFSHFLSFSWYNFFFVCLCVRCAMHLRLFWTRYSMRIGAIECDYAIAIIHITVQHQAYWKYTTK